MERPPKPGHRDLALGMKGRKQLRPAPLVAIEPPGLDQLGASVFVFQTHDLPAHRRFLDINRMCDSCALPAIHLLAERRLVACYCGTMPAFSTISANNARSSASRFMTTSPVITSSSFPSSIRRAMMAGSRMAGSSVLVSLWRIAEGVAAG